MKQWSSPSVRVGPGFGLIAIGVGLVLENAGIVGFGVVVGLATLVAVRRD